MTLRRLTALRAILRDKDIPGIRRTLRAFGLGPEDLVQWGETDNGDALLWVPAGEPEEWPTLAVESGQLDFLLLHGSSTDLLLDLLTGVQRLRIFPDDFPGPHPGFSPNPYAPG